LTGNETAFRSPVGFWIAIWPGVLFWPEQKILKKEFHNTALRRAGKHQSSSATNGYARVSLIDEERGAVIEAKAYDGSDKPLKDFNLKSLAKVNGHGR